MRWPRVVLCILPSVAAITGFSNPNPAKFLIVSSPRDATVAYMRVLRGGTTATFGLDRQSSMQTLISSGLVAPQGLAIEPRRQQLLVADPDAKKIFSYPLSSHEAKLSVGPRTLLADGVEARWVAVDGVGNIFFTDESRNQILKVTRDQALRNTVAVPEVVYDGASLAQVSAPGGVAADSFHAFWVNKHVGTQAGSVVRALETPRVGLAPLGAAVSALARNTDKSYGVCLALDNVFYTQPEKSIFGVKKDGGNPVTVSARLRNPRGCAWDGDGTVYVADRGANAVYAFAGNMRALGAAQISKTVDFEDAFGVAVFSGAGRLGLGWLLLLPAAAAAMQALSALGL